MVHQISIQLRDQIIELNRQVSNLEREVSHAGNNPEAAMDQLCHVEEIRESFDSMQTLAKQVQGIGQDILTDLKTLKAQIKLLEAKRDSILDTFQEPTSPLLGRVQGSLNAAEPFHVKISNIYQDRDMMLAELQSQGQDLHQIANHIETELNGRITDLSNQTTNAGESEQVNEFLITNEGLHCTYFDGQLQDVALTGNNREDFNALLALFRSLHTFVFQRKFVLDLNKERMQAGAYTLLETLQTLIELQRAAESDAEVPTQESIANAMQCDLNQVISSLTENETPVVETTVEDDLELAEALALSEQSTDELVGDTTSLMQAMSLIGGIGDSLIANQHSRENLDQQILMIEFLIPLQNANAAGDLNAARGAIDTITSLNPEMMQTFSLLQASLHRQLNKNNPSEYQADYGRQAFLGELPAQMAQATRNERTEVIQRALAMTLLTAIKEAILCNDPVSLRNQIDRLKALHFNKDLPGYRGEPDLESVLCDYLKELHPGPELPENNPNFFRRALRNEQGLDVSLEVKITAVEMLEEELRNLWGL